MTKQEEIKEKRIVELEKMSRRMYDALRIILEKENLSITGEMIIGIAVKKYKDDPIFKLLL